MEISNYIIGILTILNCVQAWYWSRQIQTLVDKVMSKNYADYVKTKKNASEVPVTIRLPLEDDQADDKIISELNMMLR